MKQIGLGSYSKRLSDAATTLAEHQGFDGGWGLTLTSVSSIVNTHEALTVLRAAGVGGKPVRDALSFLAQAVGEHCRPRQKGGRGEHTRFVCFALSGMLSYPQFFTQPEITAGAAWCTGWLERHQIDQGWPEVAGVDDASLHQTARAVLALCGLRRVLAGLGPDLELPGGMNTSVLLARVDPLIRHGQRGLLYHRRPSGAWGWRTYIDTAPSPSKTALCLMAVAASAGCLAAGEPFDPALDIPLETGGVSGEPVMRRPSDVAADAARWLLGSHHRWETFVEDDKDVQGTAWEHLAYALGVQAVLRAGGSPYDQRLARSWRLMDSLWDSEARMWNEPGASGNRATIRAAYQSVCAYDEARLRVAELGMAEQAGFGAGGDEGQLDARAVALVPDRLEVVVLAADSEVACPVPERLFELAVLLHGAPGGMRMAEIAAGLHVAASSVPKYVQRLNRAISEGFSGADVRLVVRCQMGPGTGYALSVFPGTGDRLEPGTGGPG